MPKETDRLPPQEALPLLETKERSHNIAYVFPGQGSQRRRMGEEFYDQSQAARRVFEEANDTLGFSLSKIIFEGPEEDLRNTINTQPALVTVSIAAHEAFKERFGDQTPTPEFVAGHSVGTISALVIAKVITFRDAVGLARERGGLMEQASKEHPGAMGAIIGLDEFALEHICAETGIEIGSINSPDQITITGYELAVARAMDLASLRGAKQVTRLPVSGAFHSKLMEPARIGLKDFIAGISFAEPQIPIIANSTAEILTDPDKIKEELIKGVCMPVRWKRSVEVMTNAGVTLLCEFGPGRVLTGLAKSMPNLNAVAINSLKSLNEFAS